MSFGLLCQGAKQCVIKFEKMEHRTAFFGCLSWMSNCFAGYHKIPPLRLHSSLICFLHVRIKQWEITVMEVRKEGVCVCVCGGGVGGVL